MSYIRNLRTFIRVYDLGSMSAAGRDLRVSAAVVSSRISELEKHLRVRLFNRTTRSLRPTEHGKTFYPGATKILDTIEEIESGIEEITAKPKGSIFISAPLGLGKILIAPLVPDFKKKYPDINIRLRLSDRKVDITNEGLDAAFVLGGLSDSELKVRKTCEFERVLCASPGYLNSFGNPADGAALLSDNHNCLMLRFPGSSEYFWSLMVDGKEKRYEFSSALESDDGDVLTAWALSGNGIINKPIFEIRQHLDSGALVPVAKRTPPTTLPFSCIYPHKRLQDMKVRLFIDFAIDAIREKVA